MPLFSRFYTFQVVVGDFFHQPYVLHSCLVFASCHYASLDATNVIVKRRYSPNRPKHKDLHSAYSPLKLRAGTWKWIQTEKEIPFLETHHFQVPAVRFGRVWLAPKVGKFLLLMPVAKHWETHEQRPFPPQKKKATFQYQYFNNIYDIFRVFN